MNTYHTLKAGDIRQKGDEQREIDGRKGFIIYPKTAPRVPGPWSPVPLLGHAILIADLCHLEFRRPV